MNIDRFLQVVGDTIRQERLNQNFSQVEIAKKAGISRRTLVQTEAGHNTSLATLFAILIALDRMSLIDSLLTPPKISPVELAKLKGKQRQRATGNRANKSTVDEPASDWTW